MLNFKQFLAEGTRVAPDIQVMLMTGAKGLHTAWWAEIKKRFPEATPVKGGMSGDGAKWMKSWGCADIMVNGEVAPGVDFFMNVMLMPQFDNDDVFSGTRIFIHDANLTALGTKTGIYSAGIKWLVDHKEQLKLAMTMGVHVSTNDDAWSRIAQKFGLRWDR